ncbi:MAG: hypothetical protein CSA58_00365 [Micrococcales bacterium]|nr:MAG: hypothetical protein CSB46_01055 [Micrococcales bacterium]PIE28181.1 MAG: hypothetical protein CSA58_00365 [Micrococcales bacterium]
MNDDVLADKLRAALAHEADAVNPGDGLDGIYHAIGQQPATAAPARRGWVVVAAAAAAAVVIGGTALVLTMDQRDTPLAGPAPATTSASSSQPVAPTEAVAAPTGAPPQEVSSLPVYFPGERDNDVFLYREFRNGTDLGDPVASAVQAMTELQPHNPGSFSVWRPASSVRVSRDGQGLTVDMSADAFANKNVGPTQARAAIQALVYTATAAEQSSGPVTVLVDGAAADAWGAIKLGEAMNRDASVRAPIWITRPQQQATVDSPLTVTGVANVYEGTVIAEAVDETGEVVAQDFGTAAQGSFAEYEITLEVPAGTYTVRAYSPNVSDGENGSGPRMFEVARTVTVR